LLVRVLRRSTRAQSLPPVVTTSDWNRLVVPAHGVEANFRIMLYPHWEGEILPDTNWSSDGKTLRVVFPDQEDLYRFGTAENGRTIFTMERDNKIVLNMGGLPPAPKLVGRQDWNGPDYSGIGGTAETAPKELHARIFPFYEKTTTTFESPQSGEVIRYALNGMEPKTTSKVYAKPFVIEKDTIIKAATFRGNVKSEVVTLNYIKKAPVVALAEVPKYQGLLCEVFEDWKTIYDDKTGFFTGKKDMLATTDDREPVLSTLVSDLEVPLVHPIARQTFMPRATYKYTGTLKVPETGRYLFKLRCTGPLKMNIGGQSIVDIRGPYYLSQRDRVGAVVLQAGVHKFELIFNDQVFFKGRYRRVAKDFCHRGMFPISIINEVEQELKLSMMAPGQSSYTEVASSLFNYDQDIKISGDLIQAAPASIKVESNGKVRYTLTAMESPFDPILTHGVNTNLEAHGEKILTHQMSAKPAPDANSPLASKLVIKEPGYYALRLAVFANGRQIGPIIDKRLQVLKKHAAVKAAVEPGVKYRTYEMKDYFDAQNEIMKENYPRPEGMHEAYKKYIRTEFIDIPKRFLDGAGVKPSTFFAVDTLKDNLFQLSAASNAGRTQTTEIFEYQGYLKVPASGIYHFDVDRNGYNRLNIHGDLVANNREHGSWPGQAIWLEEGLHPFDWKLYLSEGAIKIKAPGFGDWSLIKRESIYRDVRK
ncbi:MAG: PA14 domain-containing protein, partial [Lentisphaeraceae bacterium]|nr:PA14 domain-containing protein [Lentisphaeraceae bacterium]